MTFEQKKYQVIRQAISSELADFIFSYFVLQRDAVGYMVKHKWINPRNPFVGKWTDKQVPGAYSKYGDWAMETLLQYVRPVMMERTGLDLVPTYSYARIYEKGNILWRHKDRPSCEISTTLNLGGDAWPIYLDPTGADSVIRFNEPNDPGGAGVEIKPNAPEGIQVNLNPGDMLMYSGCELEHWREPFEGTVCAQVFLHYNHADGPFAKSNLFDKRPMLGVVKF